MDNNITEGMMNIESSVAVKIKITDVPRLDPVHVMLEDIELSKGRITITCYGRAWSAYWGGMSGRTIAQFFLDCNNDYLIGKLAADPISRTVTDDDGIYDHAKAHILKLRRDRKIESCEARDIYDDIELYGIESPAGNEDLLHRIYGDDWWYSLPRTTNHEYEYLSRICDAVKAGLAEYEKLPKAI